MFYGRKLSSFSRYFHISVPCAGADKQLLSKLRKTTGFPFVSCRKALQQSNNDLKQAEVWLKEQAQKEGWAKATKLHSRPMSQGLVGVAVNDKSAAVVEVNCETDFVARNSKFQNLVSTVANACLQFGMTDSHHKFAIDQQTIGSLLVNDKTIADITAMEVGNVGENIAVRRAFYLRAASEKQLIASYVHSTGPVTNLHGTCALGKYGSLVLYEGVVSRMSPMSDGIVSLDELGRRLCQHVVGMNPHCIGSVEDEVPPGDPAEETRLIYQEYMLDTTLTVQEVLEECGASVLDFVRFECGETLSDDAT